MTAKAATADTEHEPCADVRAAAAQTRMQWAVIAFLVATLGGVFSYYQGRLNTYEERLTTDHDTMVKLTTELPYIRQGVEDIKLTMSKITEVRTISSSTRTQ